MLRFTDLFQWERFITPSIIKPFYWLAVAMAALAGLSGIGSALTVMVLDPLLGFTIAVASVLGFVMAVFFARIVAEFVLIAFRINEHLGAIRSRGDL